MPATVAPSAAEPAVLEALPEAPPRTLGATLRRVGPGLILAGAIVGSGELIATTTVGAEAGFTLLWLILLGCVLKVFTQVELGRYTITWGRTSLEALDTLPGPRLRVNWLLWYWFFVVLLIVSQNGGIVGGVGQALAIAAPLTEQGAAGNEVQDALVRARVELSIVAEQGAPEAELTRRTAEIAALAARVAGLPEPPDVSLWAALIAVLTSFVMYFGRYRMIETVSTLFVASFTVVTITTVIMLQSTGWAIAPAELLDGLRFRLPLAGGVGDPVGTALAAFGMIGLAAGELIMYPYWCLEKGYARFTGPRSDDPAWAERARGWMRVLRYDAWLCMALYTVATVAFYLLGAAVLSRTGLRPSGAGMIRTLSEMYVPVFGSWAEGVFLFGAFTVLYSTYFVFAAGFSRIIADAFILLGVLEGSEENRRRWVRRLGVILPLAALVTYFFVRAPVAMVLAAGLGQSTILPMIGGAALYFRYRKLDPRLRPGRLWDAFLWLSFLGLLLIGAWAVYSLAR